MQIADDGLRRWVSDPEMASKHEQMSGGAACVEGGLFRELFKRLEGDWQLNGLGRESRCGVETPNRQHADKERISKALMNARGGSQVSRTLEIDAAWPCDERTPGYLTCGSEMLV